MEKGHLSAGGVLQDWHYTYHIHSVAVMLLAGLDRHQLSTGTSLPPAHPGPPWVPHFLRANFPILMQYKPHTKNYCAVRKEAVLNMEA